MTAETRDPAPGRSLWGLQLIGAAALASFAMSVSIRLVQVGAQTGDGEFYSGFEALEPLFEVTPWLWALVGLVSGAGFWLCGSLPKIGVFFRIVAVLEAVTALMRAFVQFAMQKHWIEDFKGFYEWYGTLSTSLWIASMVGGLVVLLMACSRRTPGLVAATVVGAIAGMPAFLLGLVGIELIPWLFEHRWLGFGFELVTSIVTTGVIIALVGAASKRFDSSGYGSLRAAGEGLGQYHSAIKMRIILAVSLIGMSFLAYMARAMVMIQVVMVVGVVVGVAIAIHAARGMARFARQPFETRAGLLATGAAVLLAAGVVLAGWGLMDVPALFKKGSEMRDAVRSVQAVGNYANLLGFAAVFLILLSLARVARFVEQEQLASRAHGLIGLVAVAAGAVVFLQFFGAAGLVKTPGALIVTGVTVLILAIVALVRYLGLLFELGTHLIVEAPADVPAAKATIAAEHD